MRVTKSALEHGMGHDSIIHAYENAIRFVEFEYEGEERLLILGPDVSGAMLELVALPVGSPNRIVHADRLRTKFYSYLR